MPMSGKMLVFFFINILYFLKFDNIYNKMDIMKKGVCWITLCKNEADIIPYVIPYWKRVADKVVVFDNGSDDGSVEMLSKYDWIEIRSFDSDGQNDLIQKQIKEKAYLEYKDKFEIIIITDMDEIFYFNDFKALQSVFIDKGYDVLATPIFSLCEANKPPYSEDLLLHQVCHKFFNQRMNHQDGFENISKFSIFNTNTVEKVSMSVGQHYVKTFPSMKIILDSNDFCLHINKGLGLDYFLSKRKRMGDNLSDTNKKHGMAIEYLKSEEESRKEYLENQKKSFDINKIFKNNLV